MAPRVHILVRPIFDGEHQSFLDENMPEAEARWRQNTTATPAERIVEFAGRVCYLSFGSRQSGKSNPEYIANLIRNGHESVLEHAVWTFAISGVSRAFTHQLVRHRAGFSFSQLSQQYHEEREPRFVTPAGLEALPEALNIWTAAISETQSAYRRILDALERRGGGVADGRPQEALRAIRSAARSVLPNARETAIVVTANARALRHFLRIRGCIVGDTEMRSIASLLLEHLRIEAPALFADFFIEHLDDGLPVVRHIAPGEGTK